MSAAAILFTFVVVLGLGVVGALAYIWWLHGELDRLHGSHASPRAPRAAAAERPDGAAPEDEAGAAPARLPVEESAWQATQRPEPEPARPETSLLAPVNHAQAMRDAAEPYLPPPPVRADFPVTPVRHGHAPWTGEIPALDEAALADLDRQHYIASHLREAAAAGTLTPGYMRDVMETAAAYGQAPVARVLGAERLAEVTLP